MSHPPNSNFLNPVNLEPLQISSSSIPPPTFFFKALSWNIRGLKSAIKIRHIQRLIKVHSFHFLLFQETLLTDNDVNFLSNAFPKFSWFISPAIWDAIPPERGLAIGVKSSFLKHSDYHHLQIGPGYISLDFLGPNDIPTCIISVYLHPNAPNPLRTLDHLSLPNVESTLVFAGDLNAAPSD